MSAISEISSQSSMSTHSKISTRHHRLQPHMANLNLFFYRKHSITPRQLCAEYVPPQNSLKEEQPASYSLSSKEPDQAEINKSKKEYQLAYLLNKIEPDLKRLKSTLSDLVPKELLLDYLKDKGLEAKKLNPKYFNSTAYIREILKENNFPYYSSLSRKRFFNSFSQRVFTSDAKKRDALKVHLMKKGFYKEYEGRLHRYTLGRLHCALRGGIVYPLTFIFQTAKVLLKGVFCTPVSFIRCCFKVKKFHRWTCTGVLKDFLFLGKIAEKIMSCVMGVIFAPPKDFCASGEVLFNIEYTLKGTYHLPENKVSNLLKSLRLSIPNYKKMIFANTELFNYRSDSEYIEKFGAVKSG